MKDMKIMKKNFKYFMLFMVKITISKI